MTFTPLNCSLYFCTWFLFGCALQCTDSLRIDFRFSKFNRRGVGTATGEVGKNSKQAGLDPVRVQVRVFNCATDLRILRGNQRHNLCSKQPSSTSFSANLVLNRTSLALIILAKTNVQFKIH